MDFHLQSKKITIVIVTVQIYNPLLNNTWLLQLIREPLDFGDVKQVPQIEPLSQIVTLKLKRIIKLFLVCEENHFNPKAAKEGEKKIDILRSH